ncbi:MAG: sigma-54-dependent transcriptional regulator [Sedimentisphaeraceae bacterium JB056]
MQKNGLTVLIVSEIDGHNAMAGELIEKLCSKVVYASSGREALRKMDKTSFDLVLTELNLGGEFNGLELLEQIKINHNYAEVVIVATSPTIDACKQALRGGAYDFLNRPIDKQQLEHLIGQISRKFSFVENSAAVSVSVKPKARQNQTHEVFYEGVRGRSAAFKHILKVIGKVSPTDISILIQGESGSGKELIARAIHLNSNRKSNIFRPVNCAGLSETLLESELFGHAKGAFTGAATDRKGLFETSDHGTLFLDEIGDMPLHMQAKLLRVLEDGVVLPVGSNKPVKVDVRVISATNCDLAKLVEEKKFRQDLYFRIKGVSITLPPLRSRREDMPELVYHFLEESCLELGIEIKNISERAMAALINYHWPGNIRQLQNIIRMMVVISDGEMIDTHDLPPEIYSQPQLGAGPEVVDSNSNLAGKPLGAIEKEAIMSTLEMVDGNREKAAKILGIGSRTLYRKLKDYDNNNQ